MSRVVSRPIECSGRSFREEAQTWYFKMTGPKDLVAKQEDAFRQLVESLRFAGPGTPPEWTLPPSWKQDAGTGQRLATLSVEQDGRKLEVSIIQLPTIPSSDSILENVNRWRRQMQLPPVAADQIGDITSTLKLADGTAVLVNLVGRFHSSGMSSSPMGSMASQLPAKSSPPSKPTLQYEKPAGWKVEPPVAFSVLAFSVHDGQATAQITVSPLQGNAGGLLANVNRWYRQVGLPPLAETDLASKTEDMVIQGIHGIYAEVVGDDTQAGDVIIGWIGMRDGQTWFAKMKGDRKLVLNQRGAFRNFLKSLKFSAHDGAGNGN